MKKKPKLTAQANSYGYKKYLLAMKLTTLLILLNLMPLSASIYSQNANFSFKFHNATVKEVLNQMEQQSQFRFFYNDNFIDLNRKITLNVKNVKIEELLSNLLDASAVTYKILDNNLIVITPKEVYKQQKISGVVTDATTNEPLIGVGISVQGTTQGTITDADGKYSIDVPGSASTIVVSYVGYKKQEITAGNNMVINISLIQEFTNLEEVVVVGYGVQKKSLLTGAIGSVKSDDLKNSSFQRADEAFEGKIAGIQAIPTSGAPGAALNIRIRGYGSNGNSNPLFIVDGIISADISNLDPNDILSEEVLKDAASSAIYGAQGGNGVIIITTKKGESGKSLVTYNIQYAHQTPSHLAKELNSTDYVTFMNEKNGFGVSQADGVVGGNIAQFTQGGVPVNNNWLKSVFTNGTQVKHNLSFSGGNDKTTFYSALNYLKNDGIVTGSQDKYERFTFRINAENKSNKWLKVGTNLEYSHSNTRGINENGAEFGGVVGSALQIDPTTPVEYTNGTPDWLTNEIKGQPALIKAPDGNPYGVSHLVAGEIRNPFVTQALTNGVITLDKILGGFYADISPIKGLIFTSRLGLDFSFQNNHYWNPTYYYDATNANGTTSVVDNNDVYLQWTWDNFASYNRKIGDHNITLLAGMSALQKDHRNINGVSNNMALPFASFAELTYTTHLNPPGDNVTGTNLQNKTESFFARFNYDYKGTYLLEGIVRRDGAGTSQVPASGRWGTFPSISAGWVFSNERFFPKSILSFGKVRASWGQNGSLTVLDPNFAWLQSIGSSVGGQPISYPISNGTITGAEPTASGNNNLTWENDQQTDIGLDLRALNDRLTFTVDYWDKTTKDLLFTGALPAIEATPYLVSPINGGTVSNKGLEFDLGIRNKFGDLHVDIDFNISPLLSNKVTYINPLLGNKQNGAVVGTSYTATVFEPDHSVWHFYGYKTNGIDKKTGDPIFVTAKGRDTTAVGVTTNDMQDIGSAIPKFTYGGHIRLEWKGIDLIMNMSGQHGNKILLGWYRTDKTAANRLTAMTDNHWSLTNTQASKPAINADPKTFQSDQMLYDGSFLRIQKLELGYSLPSSILQKVNVSAFRVFVSLDNFWTITNYPGMDPQPTIKNNKANAIGIDYGTYPKAKDVMFGLTLSF